MIAEVGARDVPEQVVFNKADLADEATRMMLRGMEPAALFVSARSGEGIDRLLATISALLPVPRHEVTVLIPFDEGHLVSMLHEKGRVLATVYEESGARIQALVGDEERAALEPYLV